MDKRNNNQRNNTSYKRAAGLFHTRDQAEVAVRALKNAGYSMSQVSVIAKDADKIDNQETVNTEEIGNKADEGAGAGAVTGAALGGITGLLVGLGTIAIPGIGPILLAGEIGTAIATTLAGAGIGAIGGGLVGALIGLGIPEEKAKVYSNHVEGGSFLVLVDGTMREISQAEDIMQKHNVQEFGIYDIPDSQPTTVEDVDEDIKKRTDIADDEKIRLYEERLLVHKRRQKTGEVAVSKVVETETAKVNIPVEKESVVIEQREVTGNKKVAPGTANFANGKIAKVELYEETANIDKQAFVREEVDVRKEVDRETVYANEKVRREELKVEGDADIVES